MVWYDELYSKVRPEEILGVLIKLNGKGTIKQIERKLENLYDQPKGRYRDRHGKNFIKEPLEKLVKDDVVELKGSKYTLREEFLGCKNFLDYDNLREKLKERKGKEILKMYENRKSIDDYVKGELMVKFEKKVTWPFTKDFINLLGYEILEYGFQKYYTKELENHIRIKVPKGKEQEILKTLENYKRIVEMVSLNGKVKEE